MAHEWHEFSRWLALAPAPSGLVATYVGADGMLSYEPVVAFAIREGWQSQRDESAAFDPEADRSFESGPVAVVFGRDGRMAAAEEAFTDFTGVFPEASLTSERRADLIKRSWMRLVLGDHWVAVAERRKRELAMATSAGDATADRATAGA